MLVFVRVAMAVDMRMCMSIVVSVICVHDRGLTLRVFCLLFNGSGGGRRLMHLAGRHNIDFGRLNAAPAHRGKA